MFCHRVQLPRSSPLCFEHPPQNSLDTSCLMRIDWLQPINHLNANYKRRKKFKGPNSPNSFLHIFALAFRFREKSHWYNPSAAAFSYGSVSRAQKRLSLALTCKSTSWTTLKQFSQRDRSSVYCCCPRLFCFYS